MDARRIFAAALAVVLLLGATAFGADARTRNFIVSTPNPHYAKQAAQLAEQYRRDLAIDWLGHELPPWPQPCPIRIHVGPNLGAGGATSFAFHNGQPFNWTMTIQGPPDRLLDSVLPHEVLHTVFATHFGRPLPRWADEGACTTIEHKVEKAKYQRSLIEALTQGRGIPFNQMFAMTEYPPDVLPLYAQGHSLANYLIAMKGKQEYVAFVGNGMKWNNWTAAIEKHYGFKSLSDLQLTWNNWVAQGSPPLRPLDSPGLEPIGPNGGREMLASTHGGAVIRASEVSRTAAGSTPVAMAGYDSSRQQPQNSPAAYNQQLADAGQQEGWYSRKRRRALDTLPPAARGTGNLQSIPAGSLTPGRIDVAAVPQGRTLSRPPQPQTAGQINIDGGYRSPVPTAPRQPAYAVPPGPSGFRGGVPASPTVLPGPATAPAQIMPTTMAPATYSLPAQMPMSMGPTYIGGACIGST
jgi:hypothetical protein